MSRSLQPKTNDPGPFTSRLYLAGFIGGAAAIIFLLSKVLLVIFASILFAIAICSLAKPITAFAKIPHAVAVLIATLVVGIAVAWPFMTYGSRLWAQFDEIAMDIPKAVNSIKTSLEAHPSIQFLEQIMGDIDLSKIAAPAATHLTSIISSVSTVIAYLILLAFGGVYLALSPDLYVQGLLRFTPLNYRDRVQIFIERCGASLRVWLTTQLLVVLINGAFVGIGLWAFGIHDAAALAMLAGLLSFIPYVGTIIAMMIGGLATLPQGTTFALYALVVLGFTSIIEGYFITPYIQSKTLSLPPVVLIFAIFAFTILFGTLGIILAAPLTVVTIVALETFYKPRLV
ncbi:AI-2E family transporter [Hyphomicrobium sp.]|uniref:AI-2E family transporter n=1 Tax=Hyphomicrobium sp. TaxID=82 RepID=UPI001DBED156|nr:AI-2E family transporter [Hyphomicrobium sp.]MBY0558958.1 AI-2E family transporter [Hyphomicrobium sp.]